MNNKFTNALEKYSLIQLHRFRRVKNIVCIFRGNQRFFLEKENLQLKNFDLVNYRVI